MSTINTTIGFQLSTVEQLSPATAPAAQAGTQLAHTAFDRTITLKNDSTPKGEVPAYLTLSGASGTIDLTALQTADGVKDCTGKKLRALRVTNPNATVDFTIAVGASNGYAIGGVVKKCHPGGTIQEYFADALAAVGGSTKTLDWTGNGGHTYQITLILGA